MRQPLDETVPHDLAAWFAGETAETPWEALLPGDWQLLPARWREWKAEHPGARPPAGYAWLEKEDDDG